jgi:hypothetical protein
MDARRRPFTTEETLDYIIKKIKAKFPRQFADVTFGELTVYTPDMFQGERGTTLPIVSVSPMYDRLVAESRTTAAETRARGIDIVTIVNMLPEMQAKPPEQMGERNLVRHTQYLIDFLASDEMTTLDHQVEFTAVADISWEWIIGREEQIYRSSRIHYMVYVSLRRQQ